MHLKNFVHQVGKKGYYIRMHGQQNIKILTLQLHYSFIIQRLAGYFFKRISFVYNPFFYPLNHRALPAKARI